MKLTILLLTATILHASAGGFAQSISLRGKKLPVEQVIKSVEKQTGYVFLYSREVLTNAHAVTIDAANTPLKEFLQQAFRDQPFRFSIRSKTILLLQKTTTAPIVATALDSMQDLTEEIKVTGQVFGFNNQPLVGASVRKQGTKEMVTTDNNGKFLINAEKGSRLLITYVGYQLYEWKVTGPQIRIDMTPADKKMEDVEVVVNTGFQQFKANEMVGAVDVVSEKMLKQQVGANILQRLKGMTTSMSFLNKNNPSKTSGNPYSQLNIAIRGWNTINGPTDPLIIVDNFPYEGDINNIDPNSVVSVSILKDAAAASVWGARAANGVIVIDTRKGKFNQKTRITVTSLTSISEKPNLYKLPLLSSPEYIDIELAAMKHKISDFTVLGTPVADVLLSRKFGLITPEDSAARIDYLKTIDSRDEWNKHIYVLPIEQQTSVSIHGGSNTTAWTLTANHVSRRSETRRQSERLMLDFGNTFRINPKLDIELSLSYTNEKGKTGAPEFNSITSGGNAIVSGRSIPYLQLADEQGNPVAMPGRFSKPVMDTLGNGLLLDYNLYPLTNWKHDYATYNRNYYTLLGEMKYRPVNDLQMSLSAKAQKEFNEDLQTHGKESFYTRDHVNIYTIVNRANNSISRQLPWGDIIQSGTYELIAFDLRAQTIYKKQLHKHHRLSINVSAAVRQTKRKDEGDITFGYSDEPLYHTVINPDYVFPQLVGPNILSTLYDQFRIGDVVKKRRTETRGISLIAATQYIFKDRYNFYGSATREGANILGVKTNDRWEPIWSAGFKWMIHQEPFFRLKWIDELTLNSSIGFTGNVDPSRSSNPVTNVINYSPFPYQTITTLPNPSLRWEKNKDFDLGLGFAILKRRISGSFRYYHAWATDLYGDMFIDYTQSPQPRMTVNRSTMKNYGWEFDLTTENISGLFKWITTFRGARNISKIVDNLYQLNTGNVLMSMQDGVSVNTLTQSFPGQPRYSVSAIRSGGLNAEGNIQYLLDGKPTTDLNAVTKDIITNGANSSAYVFFGSGDPTISGSVLNHFSWKQFYLSAMIEYSFGHFFKLPSVDPSFTINGRYHADWNRRWKKPGDEAFTNVPKYDYSLNDNNVVNTYFLYLSDHVRRADHLRLGYIRLSYEVPLKPKGRGIQSLGFALNASNLGVIWTANKEKIDPVFGTEYMTYSYPLKQLTLTVSLGL